MFSFSFLKEQSFINLQVRHIKIWGAFLKKKQNNDNLDFFLSNVIVSEVKEK